MFESEKSQSSKRSQVESRQDFVSSQSGVVVIGGAVVEKTLDGKNLAKAATVAYIHSLADSLGHVYLFARVVERGKGHYEYRLDDRKVSVLPLRHLGRSGLGRLHLWFSDILNLVRRVRIARRVIEFHPTPGGWHASLILRMFSNRYALYFGTDPAVRWKQEPFWPPFTIWSRIHSLLSAKISPAFVDRIFVRDQRQLIKLKERYGPKVHSASPISILAYDRLERDDACARDQIHLLFVGLLSTRKGIDDALLALRHLIDSFCDKRFMLDVVGGPDLLGSDTHGADELLLRSEELGLQGNVNIRGYIDNIDELRGFFKSADVLVLPSSCEGFPRVTEEAMAYSVPIVCYNLSGFEEVFTHGVSAMLVDTHTALALASAIREVIVDRSLRQRLMRTRTIIDERTRKTAAQQHIDAVLE